jgi:hypothetical protein
MSLLIHKIMQRGFALALFRRAGWKPMLHWRTSRALEYLTQNFAGKAMEAPHFKEAFIYEIWRQGLPMGRYR